MPPPAVSVVVPLFNAAAFLPAAVRSVRAQDGPPAEVVVIDDASTDDSAAVADRLAAADPLVRVVRRGTNGGPAAARNSGLRVAAGRYVAFLDADDEHAPGFLQTATEILDADPSAAGLVTGVELLDSPRPVHPLQLDAVARSLPGNLLVRRAAAELVGGFPEDPAFRGPAAGEDIAFRDALARHFRLLRVDAPYLRYRVRPGGHCERFLNRTAVIDGRLVDTRPPDDFDVAALSAARERYLAGVRERVGVVASVGGVDGSAPLAPHAVQAAAEFDALAQAFAGIPGFLHPVEGFALYRWARDGPGDGAVVEIGSLFGRSTAWLAAGCRQAGRGRVVAVDHFRGSPEHQPGGTHPISELLSVGSTLPAFRANLARVGLADWVDPRVGSSAEVAAGWSGPVRFLFIDGDHSYAGALADWRAWVRHVVPGGVVAFHDVDVLPDVTRLYRDLRGRFRLPEVGRANSVRLVRLPEGGR